MIALVLLLGIVSGISSDCPPPNVPNGVIIDNQGPYTDGSTVNGRCPGNGYFLGPSSMTCIFGFWAPSFLGQCSNGQQNSCPTPQPPEGGRLSSEGPFGSGDTVNAVCEDGGYVIGVSSMSCVFGHWAPSFFGACTNSKRYSCQVPSPKPGMALNREGTLKSDETVEATCTENMKVLVGIRSMTCVLGHWAPNQLGDCVDVNQLGTVVYSDGNGQVIIKFRNSTDISDLGNGELLIKYSGGGYGIEQVKGYTGTPDSQGSTWSIQNGMIYKDGVLIPSVGYSYGTVKLSGYKVLQANSGISSIPGMNGVSIRNNVVYVNGIPVAERTGIGLGGISINNMGTVGSNNNVFGSSFNNNDNVYY
ncbi:hypothetical protein Aduo_004353 [Ancylostoma duodenale]